MNSQSVVSVQRAKMTSILYLGKIAEALLISHARERQNAELIDSAIECCDRIEHIAQYDLNEDQIISDKMQITYLLQDTLFIKCLLSKYKSVLKVGSFFPLEKRVDDLIASIEVLSERLL
jgi:hypothetical protein